VRQRQSKLIWSVPRRGSEARRRDPQLLRTVWSWPTDEVGRVRRDAPNRRGQTLAAAEQERARWARELHDETLQSLASLRVRPAAQLRGAPSGRLAEAVGEAIAQLETDIGNLRELITELRPAALDEHGTQAAIRDLAERARGHGLEVDLTIDLATRTAERPSDRTSDVETAIYRIVQESLTNAIRHRGAKRAMVTVEEDETTVRVTVQDDSGGFDITAKRNGFGMLDMHERAQLSDGTLEIRPAPGEGTKVKAALPARRQAAQAA